MDARARVALLSSTVAGRRIDSLRADLTLSAGRLGVRGLGMVEGTAVALEADARPFDAAPSIHLRRAELRAVELQRLLPNLGMTTSATVVASGSLAGGVASIHADVRDSGGRATLAAVARPLDTVPSLELHELRLEDVNLARLLGDPRLDSRIQGNITGQAQGTDKRDLTATVALDLDGSTVGDRLLRTGRSDVELNRGRLRLTGSVASGVDSLAIVAAMDASRAVVHASGIIHDARVDSAEAVLSLTEGRRQIDTLWVQSNLGTVSGSGTIPSSLRVVGKLNDIGPVAPLLGLDSLATDSLSFTAGLGTPADSLAVSLTGRTHGLVINESRFGEIEWILAGRLDPARRSLDSGNGRVTLQRFAKADATVEAAAVNAVYASGEVGITADAAMDRDRNARIVARWFRGDSARIQLDTVQLRVVSGNWGLVHPVEIGYGRRLSFGDLVLAAGKQRIAVDGAVDRDGNQSLHVSLDSVRFGPLAELFGIRRLDGVAAGTFDLRGTAASPQAEGEMAVTFLSAAERLGRARGSVSWDSLGLGLDVGLTPKKGDSLTIRGVVPVQLSLAETDSSMGAIRPIHSGRFELDARTRAFHLESLEPMLASDDIGKVRGLLSLELALRGSAGEPVTSGSIRLADLKVEAPKLGATYRGDVAASLSGRELRLTSAKVRAGGGEADVTGGLRIADSARLEGDLDATLREFQVAAAKDFGSKLSGQLHLGGTSVAPKLSGKITTQNAYFYLTSGNSQGAVNDVELTPEELAIVERRFGSLATRPQRPGLTQATALDLDVTLGPNNWIRRRSDPVVSVELGGELGIEKESGGRLEVRGDVEALPGRSVVELVGRRFELMRGGAQLKGPLESAELGLEAEYRVASQGQSTGESDVVITAEVTADTGSIAVTLGSRPNMEQRDIMSYLLTGAPATTDPTMQAASGQSYISTGASLALGAALGSLAGSAGQELGFDVVQILQDLQGAQTLVAGKYVSPDLYIGFRQPLTEATADNDDPENVENVMEFEVEYAAFRKALLNFQGAGSEFRVFLRLRGGN
jgi:hypothetical protein